VEQEIDVAVLVGIKSGTTLFNSYLRAGKQVVLLDKGFVRGRSYWRVSVNAIQPLAYFQRIARPPDRLKKLELTFSPWRDNPRGSVVFCSGTGKFAKWHGLPPAGDYARQVLKKLQRHTTRKLIYRPKPGREEQEPPIPGFEASLGTGLESLWPRLHGLVTYGSNAAVEAILAGIPALVLGDGIARPISSTSLAEIENLRKVPREQVYQWACDWAYCQWTAEEMRSGEMWKTLRRVLEDPPPIRLGGTPYPLE